MNIPIEGEEDIWAYRIPMRPANPWGRLRVRDMLIALAVLGSSAALSIWGLICVWRHFG